MEQNREWLIGFGMRLRGERERQGLSRADLAELAHTDQGYIVQLERGAKSPSLRLLKNILNALDSSADYLIFGKEDEREKNTPSKLQNLIRLLETRDEKDAIALSGIIKSIIHYKEL